MTEIKGIGISTMPLFIKEKFGEDGYNNWLSVLKDETREEYEASILTSGWYPIQEMCIEPELKMCELFYSGDLKGAWEFGRYNAEYALKGIYKIFVKIGSPEFIIGRASQVMSTYYRPTKIEMKENGKKNLNLNILEFEGIDEVVEYRIGGWVEKALEICGCMNVNVKIEKSLAKGDEITEFLVKWVK